ncbi:cytochrome c oxidase subunit II [Sphingomonas sp.]|uniref:cytochrome c oxidase subunit II n=1 Tax=Sphingomonas sp. TaxID=28214 RepID=UPI001DDF31B6|nr:cytochrome c oxidase subunit II [Sphingomonas sp.]MBX9797750.1 cytochrome c oxidase subunit II [Sphingomonas sp.]
MWRSGGVKAAMLAAGLMIGTMGVAPALATAPQAPTTEQTQAAAPVAGGTEQAAAKADQAPAATDPLLAVDGGPEVPIVDGVGQPKDGLLLNQPQVTPNGERAAWMHDYLLVPIITFISLFVLGLLLWAMVRYRRAANPVPSKVTHNLTLEFAWTIVPVIILVIIAVPSIGLLQAQFKPAPANAVTLKAIGNQWYWSYEYPDHGIEITSNLLKEKGEAGKGERFRTDADGPRLLATDNRVVLPTNTPIRLVTTANDVIHSWAMPAFWIKLDAVPGKLNETSFTIAKPGVYFGQCSELCGARHGYMPITVVAVDRATFDKWVIAKGGKPKAAATPAAAPAPAGEAANAAAPADANAAAPADANTTAADAAGNAAAPANATGN